MDHMPDLDRNDVPKEWLTRAGASGGCHHGSFDPRPATPADAADNDLQIKERLDRLGKKADDVGREALTAMQSAPFDRPERGRIAVKVVTATGMEMTAVQPVAGE